MQLDAVCQLRRHGRAHGKIGLRGRDRILELRVQKPLVPVEVRVDRQRRSLQVRAGRGKALPDNWVTGEIGGTCIDANDHLFAVTRGFQTGGLVSPEGVGGAPKSVASPPVIEFDQDGNVVNSWGDPSLVATGPNAG